jgi:hypothetical protein
LSWIALKHTNAELLTRGAEGYWVNLDRVLFISFREARGRRPASATLVFERKFSTTTEDAEEIAALREYLRSRSPAGL